MNDTGPNKNGAPQTGGGGGGSYSSNGMTGGAGGSSADAGFTIKVGDLVDSEFVNSQLTSYYLIIHCAAKSSVWGSYDSFYKANVVATKNLLEVIHSKQQLIYISTANIYFNFQNEYSISPAF